MRTAYPAWLRDLSRAIGRRSRSTSCPNSCCRFSSTDEQALFVVIDCLRLDQWRFARADARAAVRHRDDALLQRPPHGHAVLAQRAVQRTVSRRDRGALSRLVGRARRRDAQRARAPAARGAARGARRSTAPVRYEKVSTAAEGDDIERRLSRVIAPEGISAFVFNFVDLLTHGRSESAILYEVARDEIALRQLTQQWFRRSALFSVLKEAARRNVKVLVTSDHGSIHCRTPATVFAKRDATQNLRYKFGEDLRAENPEQGMLFTNEDSLKLPRRGLGANTLLATGDSFFVYPTKLREYQSRYRGSFLHGGVTPEECILPGVPAHAEALSDDRARAPAPVAAAVAGRRPAARVDVPPAARRSCARTGGGWRATSCSASSARRSTRSSSRCSSRSSTRCSSSRRRSPAARGSPSCSSVVVGAFLDPNDRLGSAEHMMWMILADRRGEERVRLGGGPARRVAPGVRDARSAERGVPAHAAASARRTSSGRRPARSCRRSSPTPSRRRS